MDYSIETFQLHAEMISRPLNGPLVIQIVYQIMAMATIWYYMATKWHFLAFYLKRYNAPSGPCERHISPLGNWSRRTAEETANNKYVVVATEYSTKWPEARAIPDKSTNSVPRFLLDLVYRFGSCHNIIHDHGWEFNNSLVSDLCQQMNTAVAMTSVYHPQTNGYVQFWALRKIKQQTDFCIWMIFFSTGCFLLFSRQSPCVWWRTVVEKPVVCLVDSDTESKGSRPSSYSERLNDKVIDAVNKITAAHYNEDASQTSLLA